MEYGDGLMLTVQRTDINAYIKCDDLVFLSSGLHVLFLMSQPNDIVRMTTTT